MGRHANGDRTGASHRVRWGRLVGIAGAVVLLGAAGVVFASNRLMHKDPSAPSVVTDVRKTAASAVRKTIAQSVPSMNILLIGNNARNASSPLTPGQADLMFVVHIVPAQHQVVFISIPRNLLVAMPNWNDPAPMIKGAFFMGGPKLAMQEASTVLGMPVTHYVVADFGGFVQAINAIGGLTVDVEQPIYDPTHSGAVFSAGVHHMNGEQLLAYIRVRQNQASSNYRVNDFQRMDAAYGVMSSVRQQVLANMGPTELIKLLTVWREDVATNLSTATITELALSSLHASFVHITLGTLADSMYLEPTTIPGVNVKGTIVGGSYDILSSAQLLSQLAPYGSTNPTTGLPPLPAPGDVSVIVGGDSQITMSALTAAGIHATFGSSIPDSGGATLVLYPAGDLSAAEVVGQALGQSNEELQQANVASIEVEPGN